MNRQSPQKILVAALAGIGLLCSAIPTRAADVPLRKREAELDRKLEQQGAELAQLQRRVAELERLLEKQKTGQAAAAQPQTRPAAPAGKVAAASAPPPAPAQSQPPAAGAGRPAGASGGPGSFSVDEEAAQRALERTLTQTGALLLPRGQIDFEPSVTYLRRETTVNQLQEPASGYYVFYPTQVKRDEVTGNLALKIGLPWESQLELGLPYNFVHQSTLADFGTLGRTTSSANANGLGDFSIGIAKTLTHERGWRPDVIGRLTYIVGNGQQSNNGVVLAGGSPAAQVQVVALARQDPLAFVGSLYYQKAFTKNEIKQGDQAGFSLGALMAASPQTSLLFAFSQTFVQKLQLNGVNVPGSEQTIGMLNLGASSILAKNVMLDATLGVGLGADAPRYVIQLTLPIRFN